MVKKTKLTSRKYIIPNKLNSVEHLIFIASWIDFKKADKGSKPISFHGVDLLSRKISPEPSFFFSYLSEILQEDIKAETMLGSMFIIPEDIVSKLKSAKFLNDAISNKEKVLNLWINIAAYETIEFINYLLKKINSNHLDNAKAIPIVNRLLLNFSTGQLWSLAYKTNQKVCEIIVVTKLTNNDYSELFLDIFLDRGLFYIDKGWKLTPFKRFGFQCRQSDYSKFFFDKVLGIFEEGFSIKPNLATIEKREL